MSGAPLAAPTVFNSLTNQLVFNPETAVGSDGHLRSYTGTWGGSSTGDTVCYDWTAAAACAGFPLPATHPSANGGVTRDYGYAFDQTTRCLFGLGDAGILFSEDPTTSSSPCIHSGADVTLTPSAFYCDGGTGHIHSYTNARLENMNLANVDLTASTADVSDTGGPVIAHPTFAPDGTLDLSGISPAAHPSITVSAHLVLNNSNDFTGGNQPHLVWRSSATRRRSVSRPRSRRPAPRRRCPTPRTGNDATGALTSNTVSLPVAPGPACQPTVTVNKEICVSVHDDNCQPGGPGPWAKHATPGLLGLLLANPHWRITVTDTGPTDITGVTINDNAAPSCRSAAGTFDLAAGQSKQIYCSTSLLISLLPFTNTASATYTPTNSPAGTPPSRTNDSSAVACSLLGC
ncbi:DUF7617 domain-containing protein [Kutzneria kofuensis]|uniref:DUF7617 domain-containing protein n=1 Tax=Kutzneria kofuensis TaxID=103725 RepID=UPI0031E94342